MHIIIRKKTLTDQSTVFNVSFVHGDAVIDLPAYDERAAYALAAAVQNAVNKHALTTNVGILEMV